MELLPCPFCGGKATFDHDDNGWNWVVCEKCGVSTNCRVSAMDDCKPILAEAWNRRASPASAQKVSTRVAAIAKAEETEALTAAINALEDIAGTSSSTRIRRVANEALKATRARRKA